MCRKKEKGKEKETLESKEEKELKEKGYKWEIIKENYGGVPQRWLLVENRDRKESKIEKIVKEIPLEKEKAEKEKKKIVKELWCDKKECEREVRKKNKTLKYYRLEIEEIKKEHQEKYKVTLVVTEKKEEIQKRKNQAGKFIIATNIVEDAKLESWQILWQYKQQQKVERGFRCLGARSLASCADAGSHRFLKNPLFFADSFYVKKVKRLEGILWLMSLSLLVYNLGQSELRKELKRKKVGLKNQLGKRTHKVTMRWIFQCLQGIHVVKINEEEKVVNMNKDREEILEYLPAKCREYYQ